MDDEQIPVEVVQGMALVLGYPITARTSSSEALELFRAKPDQFDLVIADMTMGNMRGDKLALDLRCIRPDIPIIMYTGFSEFITKERSESIGKNPSGRRWTQSPAGRWTGKPEKVRGRVLWNAGVSRRKRGKIVN